MFPFDLDDANDNIIKDQQEAVPSDYEIDFTTGKLTGRIISGLDYIKQWIRLALATDRYYFTQYSWQYGHELSRLLGQSFSHEYLVNETKRLIADALKPNKYIQSISNVECEVVRDALTATFTVNTIFGSGEVKINV